MKKIGICGRIGNNINLLTGQAVKTKIVTNVLVDIYGEQEIEVIDTYNWKKHPFKLLVNCFSLFKNTQNIIFFPAQSGVKLFVPLFLFINKFYKRKLHYYVVGGWITDMLSTNQKLCRDLKKLDALYVELPSMKDDLEKRGYKNICFVNKFREIVPISIDELPTHSSEPYKLCTFSRVMKEKGIEDAVEAVVYINTKMNRIVYTLDIYGQVDDDYLLKFEEMKNTFPKYISYKGEVPFQKSATTLKNYFALLFPTYYHGEGYPNTIVDAFAVGLPIIATNWKYNAEIINDNVDGIVYDYKDRSKLKKVLLEIMNKPEIINNMRENCINRCTEYIPIVAIKNLISNLR